MSLAAPERQKDATVSNATFHAADLLCGRVDRVDSATCVGLDPVVEKLPSSLRPTDASDASACARAVETFSLGVIDAVAADAAAVKIQAACFERYGPEGYAAMWRVLAAAGRSGLVALLDFKRGDIGISADHYAASARAAGAHWTTISAYLGSDGIAPFLAEGRGTFALVRTSNPSGDALQALRLADGRTVAEAVADLVAGLGASSVGASGFSTLGAVVGATKRAEIAALRARMPKTIFLVPGYGAQGGTADDVRACFVSGHRGALITASRSVIYPSAAAGASWQQAIRDAARVFADEIRAITRGNG
jgi:orotidine-5'-phosphate decarboxylase